MKRFALFLLSLGLTVQFALSQPGAFSLVSPTNGAWSNATPFFDWGNSTGAAYYQLWIDGTLRKDSIAVSQYQIGPSEALTEALHTWFVRARNGSGQTTQSTESWSVIIDATSPNVFDLLAPQDNSWVSDVPFNYSWQTSGDAGSGFNRYELQIDTLYWAQVTSVSQTSLNSALVPFVPEGTHSWRIGAFDNVGNRRISSSIRNIRFDYTPPVGAYNPAIMFDGASGYVEVPHDVEHVATSAVTLEAWINFQSGGTGDPVVVGKVKRDAGGWSGYMMHTIGTTTARTIGFRLSASVWQTNQTLSAGTWYHVACVFDASQNLLRIYINGNLDYTATTSGTIPATYSQPLQIGRRFHQQGPGDYFKGVIDEVRVWRVPRTQSQIRAWMRRNLQGNESGLVGYWRFNEGGGTVVQDLSTRGDNGTLVSPATYVNSTLVGTGLEALLQKSPADGNYLSTTTPTLSWGQTTDAGVGFQKYQLWIDGAMRQDNITDTAIAYGPLSYGFHSWYAKTFDVLGNNQSSAYRAFYVDNVPPNSFNLVSPTDGQVVTIPTPTFTWQATSDSTGGSGLRKYQLVIDGTVNIDSIPPTSTSSGPAAPLIRGAHTWLMRAIDNVGNIRTSNASPRAFFYDYAAPSTFSLLTPANNDTVPPAGINFQWRRSIGAPTDTLRYTIRIKRVPSGLDTSIANLLDTSRVLNWVGVLAGSSTYRWWVAVTNGYVTVPSNDTLRRFFTPLVVSVDDHERFLPTEYRLHQNYPNPFNPSTSIVYDLPRTSHVRLTVFDLLGREVATLVDDTKERGRYEMNFAPHGLASGIYLYRIQAGTFIDTKKLILLR